MGNNKFELVNIDGKEVEVDVELAELVRQLNRIVGITTYESCFGHGDMPPCIWFGKESDSHLAWLAWLIDGCHCGVYGWEIRAYTDCCGDRIRFRIEYTGHPRDAIKDAAKSAAKLSEAVKELIDSGYGEPPVFDEEEG